MQITENADGCEFRGIVVFLCGNSLDVATVRPDDDQHAENQHTKADLVLQRYELGDTGT